MVASRWHYCLLCVAVFGCAPQAIPELPDLVPSPAPLATPVERPGWPCLHGPAHNSISGETRLIDAFPPEGPRALWRRAIGTSFSSPVVTERGLVVFYREMNSEIIACLEPATGESKWSRAYPTAWVCKYDYSNGPYSTPVVDGDVVYAVGAEGKLHALSMDEGEVLWQRDLQADYEPQEILFCIGSSPLIDGERLYFTLGGSKDNSGTICLDKRTGETLWTATDHAAGYATPVIAAIHGRKFLFVFDHFGLVALDPGTGRVHWEIPFQSRSPDTICATSPAVHDDLVLVTMGPAPGALCVRVLPDGSYEEVWREKRVIDSTWNNLVYTPGGDLYGFTSKRIRSQLRSIDIRTGEVRWSWESDLERGSLLAADGKLLCFGEHGHLALLTLNAKKCEVLAQTESPLLKTPCYPSPALLHGLLYLKSETEVACFDLRE